MRILAILVAKWSTKYKSLNVLAKLAALDVVPQKPSRGKIEQRRLQDIREIDIVEHVNAGRRTERSEKW